MLVRIKRGAIGIRSGKSVVLKDRHSEPFEVDDELGEKLVADKIAEPVVATGDKAVYDIGQTSDKAKPKTPEKGKNEAIDATLTVAQLREIAKSKGIELKPRMTKAEIMEKIRNEL